MQQDFWKKNNKQSEGNQNETSTNFVVLQLKKAWVPVPSTSSTSWETNIKKIVDQQQTSAHVSVKLIMV